eukprot:Phypoly_transcript_06205.p1 GENE.Phypoly_transcript_06205~~Phypoly_transcript_06205.p1  ORF type:complete len:493 (+),score=80.24 Phypoly_transcript_06205:134-1480(+)
MKFAEREGFDYKVAENWYQIRSSTILAEKGGYGVLYHHNNNVAHALVDLFPEIDFIVENFETNQPNWRLYSNRKQFLENYARERGFDPAEHENWFTEESQQYLFEHARGILTYYDSNIGRLASDLFPAEPPLAKHSIRIHVPQNYWRTKANRRKFFLNFAKAKGFDPLVASNWYARYKEIKGVSGILSYHNKSISAALLDLFPDIGLKRERFSVSPSKHWQEMGNRKKFFEDFAHSNGFDPHIARNWTNERRSKIVSQKGAKGILHYYSGNVRKALAHVFPNIGISWATKSTPSKWMHREMKKQVVLRVARANGLNPFDPHLKLPPKIDSSDLDERNVVLIKGAKDVLSQYNGSLQTAITELFFPHAEPSKKYWKDPKNIQEAFVGFAKDQNFDPFRSSEWYMITPHQLQSIKALKVMSSHYGGSTANAIMSAFPSLNLERSKFLFLK